MRSPSILLLMAAVAAAQSYTVTTLPPPTGFLLFNLDGSMNNKGQVLGDAGSSGAATRFPVLWTGGVPQILPMPAGHAYLAVLQSYKINDAGTVIGTVQESGSTRTHIAVWKDGVPSVLPDAPLAQVCPSPCACKTPGSSTSYALNSAGRILGSTAYPSSSSGGTGCSAVWVSDGTNYRILPFPQPPQCAANTTGIGGIDALNDADQVLEDVTNFFCGSAFPGVAPAIIQPNGTYSFVPTTGLRGTALNNIGDVLGYYTAPTHVVLNDAAGAHDFGSSGYAYMNNLGNVAFISSPFEFSYQIQVWRNGAATPITVPPGLPLDPHNVPVVAGYNDAGQIAVQIPGVNAYLLSPSGPCGQDVSSQVQVTRGGFRLNRTTQHFTQLITLTNNGSSVIDGPISVALDGVPSTASLFGIAGDTLCAVPQGSPYLNAPAASLSPGASTTVTLDFINTTNSGITYTTRVLAGSGGR